jgi:hypothetical protein
MPTTNPTNGQFNKLIEFRQAAYRCLGNARDAQFELADAVLLTPVAQSFVELALAPAFRRRWSSVYEALQDGTPDRQGLLRLYAAQIPSCSRPLLAGDHTAWPRLAAETLRDRTVEHQPTKIRGQKPITVGQGYSTLAWLPAETAGQSWALPLLHERIASTEAPIGTAVRQLRQVTAQLAERPISLWDAEYGTAPFVNASADIPADKVFRLRPNLCLRRAPPPYSGHGRPPVHGPKFKLADATTWGTPDEAVEFTDTQLGPVRLSRWGGLHFQKSPTHPMVVVHVERLAARGTRRDPKDFWVAWVGQPPPPLRAWWRLYLRRFAVDHWYRLAKQRLHWTLPRLSTPEQAERWSDLLPLVTWELWLAREIVADKPRPWQKPQAILTPGRVAQGMGGVLAVIGTPARVPKPRGKSPGWTKGQPRKRRERYEVVLKGRKKKKKAA